MKNSIIFFLALLSFFARGLWSSEPWHLFGKNGVNIQPAWNLSTGDKDVNIAVIDNGFLPDHGVFNIGKCGNKPELFNLVNSESEPKKYHGAMVSSLLYTCEDNPFKLIGINKNSRFLWLERGYSREGYYDVLKWALGEHDIKYFSYSTKNQNPAHVINMSFGISTPTERAYLDRLDLLPLINKANSQGRILVAAAGNDGKNADLEFPASVTGVISVGYTNRQANAAGWSNWGETVEIMAPGTDIPVADIQGKKELEGSSLATPIVSGIISLMRSVYPELNWKLAVYFLQSTSVPMDCHAYCIAERESKAQNECQKDCCIGNMQTCSPGRVDAGAAVAAAKKAATEGLPLVALVDTDSYLVSLKPNAALCSSVGQFKLFNLGGGRGKYKITAPDGDLFFNDDQKELEVELAAKGQPGDSVIIKVRHPQQWDWNESKIRIASPVSGLVSSFSDEMVIYAGPDRRFSRVASCNLL